MYMYMCMYYQERMSCPKGGRSVKLREMHAFESERLLHFPYMDLNLSGP